MATIYIKKKQRLFGLFAPEQIMTIVPDHKDETMPDDNCELLNFEVGEKEEILEDGTVIYKNCKVTIYNRKTIGEVPPQPTPDVESPHMAFTIWDIIVVVLLLVIFVRLITLL